MVDAVTPPPQLESWMVYNFQTKRKVNAQTMLRFQILLLFSALALVPTLQKRKEKKVTHLLMSKIRIIVR